MASSTISSEYISEAAVASMETFFWHFALAKQPFASWQMPGQNQQHWVASTEVIIQKINIETSKPGFAISPFLNPDLAQTYFIPADYHFVFQNFEIAPDTERVPFEAGKTKPDNAQAQALWWQQLPRFEVKNNYQDTDFQALVSKAVQTIQAGNFQKVVLSRCQSFPLSASFDPVLQFQHFCRAYPHAFVYMFYLPEIGFWMGATPETLISIDENQLFKTVALAGTQANQSATPLTKATWTQKEIEEQAMVSRYIIDCFKKIRLREFEEEGPKTVVAGNLLHLRTLFSVDMHATNFPQLGSVMLELLHPTSAVCGMPKPAALAFILEQEGYPRSFYSGFLGPVNIAQTTHLFVNLRCMQLCTHQAILYAGAGITEDSEPQKEWNETALKMQTLLSQWVA
jgi:isochorismate synthase